MGHIDHRDAELFLYLLDLKAHGLPELGVEVTQRLVEKQEGGLRHQSPCQGHALLLSAGELVREALGVLAQVHNGEHPFHRAFDLRLRRVPDGQRVGHVVEHVHVRPHGVALEHHAHAALFRRHEGLPAGDELPVDIDFAARRLFKARDHAQHGGLAAAGRAEQRDEFAVLKFRVKRLEHNIVPKSFGDVPDCHSCHQWTPFKWRTRPWSGG